LTVLSDILQIKNAGEWSRLNHQGVGAAQLLYKLETYLSTLLSALELTTTESSRPYNVVTDNIGIFAEYILLISDQISSFLIKILVDFVLILNCNENK
jgi:hypothetical protein